MLPNYQDQKVVVRCGLHTGEYFIQSVITTNHEILHDVTRVEMFPSTYAPAATEIYDERYNPKAWAQWMREFLFELFGEQGRSNDGVERNATVSLRSPVVVRIRSACLLVREWKMKRWVQALEVS